jgi:uncharacterized iron-regulated membrane protein
MTPRAVRSWKSVHKWSSLVCTLFLFVLCLTGLLLIFHDEIDQALGAKATPDTVASTMPLVPLDRILEITRAKRPGDVITFAVPDDDEPMWHLFMAPALNSPQITAVVTVDGHTGRVLRVGDSARSPAIKFIMDLHEELLLGENGMLFLGLVALCFLLAIVSGVIVYGPFMRRLDFGAVRARQRRLYWLDLHNLTGIVLAAWMLVVGVTGLINTLAQQVARHWQSTELAQMVAPWRSAPVPAHLSSPQAAVDTALAAAPGMKVKSVAMPGTPFAGGHHYGVFLSGDQPLTSRLIKPFLINAADGTLSDSRDLPWYAKALFISKPLHFGDYGGMPLKIIWALLDVMTLVVLGSGLYLWGARFGRASSRPHWQVVANLVSTAARHP